jgi:glycogen debranching enzyme
MDREGMSYPEYEVQRIKRGQFLSNPYAFAILTATSDIGGIWNPRDREFYCHSWELIPYFGRKAMEPRRTRFCPSSQSTYFSEDFVRAEKTTSLPISPNDYQKAIWIVLRIRNEGAVPVTISTISRVKYSEGPWRKVRSRVLDKRSVYSSDESGERIRIISSSSDFSTCNIEDDGVELRYTWLLNPSTEISVGFVLAFSEREGGVFPNPDDFHEVLARSSEVMDSMLSNLSVFVPDRLVNQGIQWAKVGALRARQIFLYGPGISSDPPGDMMKVRDLFWYVMGAYHLDPEFAKNALASLSQIYQNLVDGPVPESISGSLDPPLFLDYNLNINDNTPLFIIACHKVFEISKDMEFLSSVYPAVEKATRYMISQIFGGLVRCLSEGANMWGICGWRNFIPEAKRNGAVAEVNAECYRALICSSQMASVMGDDELAKSAAEYADLLWRNIKEELIDKGTGLPLTAIDLSGEADDEVTGDIALVAIFGDLDPMTIGRIASRLCEHDFWTEYGIRTVSESSPHFDPYGANGFLGGVSIPLSCWVLRILAREDPDKALRLARNICRILSHPNPSALGNLVPTQFPEWLDGEGFKCLGQTLSPKASSSFLWAIIEGFIGLQAKEGIEVDPILPHEWRWVAFRKARTWMGDLSMLIYDGKIFSTLPIRSPFQVVLCDEDITDSIEPRGSALIGLRKGDEIFILPSGLEERASVFIGGVAHEIRLDREGLMEYRVGGGGNEPEGEVQGGG